MASQWTDEQRAVINQKFTLKGRILHPNLLKLKKKNKPEDRDIFDVQFVWNPMENGQATQNILQWIQQATSVFHQGINPIALINPLKASGVQGFPEYVRQDGRPNQSYLQGCLWVNASTGREFPPQVVKSVPGMGLVRLTENDNAEVYSGRNAAITISFYPIIPKPGAVNQKRGFSVNVDAVLILDGGEVIQGSAAVDVNAAFGSFVQDMGMTPNFGGFGQAQPAQQAPMGNGMGMHGAPAGNGQTQFPPTNTAFQGAPAQQSAPIASPFNAPAWNGQQQQQVQVQQPQPQQGQQQPPWGQPNFNPNGR